MAWQWIHDHDGRRAAWAPNAVLLLLSALILPTGPRAAHADDADLARLLDGVREIAAPGVPGPLCVYGDDAFPVAAGGSSGDTREPVVAAARLGRGRVAAFGHNGYFGRASLDTADTGRFVVNAARWAAEGATGGAREPRVGVDGRPELVAYLQEHGIQAEAVALDDLAGLDVVFTQPWNFETGDVAVMERFVTDGGGLVMGGPAWGWMQLNPGKSLETDLAGNRLLAAAGIQWADGYLSRTSTAGYAADAPPPTLTHAARALDALVEHAEGRSELPPSELDQVVTTLTKAAQCLPRDDRLLLPRLEAILSDATVHRIPTPEQPITRDNVLGRLALILELSELGRLPPDAVEAHPAAATFPGAVPDDAPRITRDLTVDTRTWGWHGTGLYSAPGEPITVHVPESAAGKGLRVRIGAHTDTLWHHAEWRRVPAVARADALDAALTRVASAFGGLVYIDVPRASGLGAIDVRVSGAVAAPRYVLGRTDPDAWRELERHQPAPWAELETSTIVVTVPSDEVRALDDPRALLTVWNYILDLDAELATRPFERDRAERIVPDEQISAGYMHAGYPIMTHLDQRRNLVDRDHLLAGNWGLFHELGHNHQSADWTFAGTGEVTVNLFTLYVFDRLCGLPPELHGRTSAEARRAQMARYDFADPDFEQWQREPFLALVTYVQLQQAFGWEAYEKVFAEYRGLAADERPASDEEKRDQWLVRFARTVGRDLGPFFQAWGIPTSEEARASVADLPAWMPEGFPPGPTIEPTATPGAEEPPTSIYLPLVRSGAGTADPNP